VPGLTDANGAPSVLKTCSVRREVKDATCPHRDPAVLRDHAAKLDLRRRAEVFDATVVDEIDVHRHCGIGGSGARCTGDLDRHRIRRAVPNIQWNARAAVVVTVVVDIKGQAKVKRVVGRRRRSRSRSARSRWPGACRTIRSEDADAGSPSRNHHQQQGKGRTPEQHEAGHDDP
jgi:hypothetical protein